MEQKKHQEGLSMLFKTRMCVVVLYRIFCIWFLVVFFNLSNLVKHSNRVWKCQCSSQGYLSLSIVLFSSCNAACDKILETKDDD